MRVLNISFLVFIMYCCTGQNALNSPMAGALNSPNQHAKSLQKYELAKKYDDSDLLFDALYDMLAVEPNNLDLKDTLAVWYFKKNLNVQAINVNKEILEARPGSIRNLEMMAICNNELGQLEESLAHYQMLEDKTKSPFFSYHTITLSYNLKQFDVAESKLNLLLASNKDFDKTVVTVDLTADKKQVVPIKAALYNIKGVMQDNIHKDKVKAKLYFEQALALYPNFVLAKKNLQNVL